MSPLTVRGEDFNERNAARDGVAITAEVRMPAAGRYKVRLLDLSQTGFRMESLTFLPDDRAIFLTIPGFAQLEARIAWRSEWTYGCQFSRPLYAAVFDHIVRMHPALDDQ